MPTVVDCGELIEGSYFKADPRRGQNIVNTMFFRLIASSVIKYICTRQYLQPISRSKVVVPGLCNIPPPGYFTSETATFAYVRCFNNKLFSMKPNAPYLLVVDDDADDWLLFEQEFFTQTPGTDLIYKNSGDALMQYLDDCMSVDLPYILLLDFKLPDFNAPEILRLLNSDDRYKHIIKVVWSTSRRTKDMEDCKRLGATDYFIKPARSSELNK